MQNKVLISLFGDQTIGDGKRGFMLSVFTTAFWTAHILAPDERSASIARQSHRWAPTS
jgi:hypothetical protein